MWGNRWAVALSGLGHSAVVSSPCKMALLTLLTGGLSFIEPSILLIIMEIITFAEAECCFDAHINVRS